MPKPQPPAIEAPRDGKCNYVKVDGTRCKMQAGWGTVHVGEGNCKKHGGAGRPIIHGKYSKFDKISKPLKEAYEDWCKENEQDPVTRTTFKNRLIERGVGEKRFGKGRFWTSVRLKNDDDNGDKSDKTEQLSYKPPHEETKLNTFKQTSASFVCQAQRTDETPPYPTAPCHICGGSWYLTGDNQWLCERCHPKPEGQE